MDLRELGDGFKKKNNCTWKRQHWKDEIPILDQGIPEIYPKKTGYNFEDGKKITGAWGARKTALAAETGFWKAYDLHELSCTAEAKN